MPDKIMSHIIQIHVYLIPLPTLPAHHSTAEDKVWRATMVLLSGMSAMVICGKQTRR